MTLSILDCTKRLSEDVPLTVEERAQITRYLYALGHVWGELDGTEWGSDTPSNIAAYLEAAGLEINDNNEDESGED